MRRLLRLFLVANLLTPLLWCQPAAHQQLIQGLQAIARGDYAGAARQIAPIADSHDLSRQEQGRAWTLLGYAYKEQGQFVLAQAAYEKSLTIFDKHGPDELDYANTLNNMADLYRDTGRLDLAKQIWLRSLPLYADTGEHSCMSGVYVNLSGIALEQHHRSEARKMLANAEVETRTGAGTTEDAIASLRVMQAWLTSEEGHRHEAIAEFQQAVDLWTHAHGAHHPLTAWGYILLGKADAADGRLDDARTNLRQGMAILEETVGKQNPKYSVASIIYSGVLQQAGMREEAAQIKAQAQESLTNSMSRQCPGCTVSVWALMPK